MLNILHTCRTWLSGFVLLFPITAAAADVESLLAGYDRVQDAVAYDRYGDIPVEALTLTSTADEWLENTPVDHSLRPYVTAMGEAALALSEAAEEEEELRKAFSPFAQAAVRLVKGNSALEANRQLYYCPMVKNRFPYWMQKKTEPMANPYMGKKMLKCGSKKPWSVLPTSEK